MDDKTPEERLAAIEALMGERLRTGIVWRKDVNKKLDTILGNHKSFITTKLLKEGIAAHADSCPGNPGNPVKNVNMTEMLKQNLKPILAMIGILGVAVTTINVLVIALLKSLGLM